MKTQITRKNLDNVQSNTCYTACTFYLQNTFRDIQNCEFIDCSFREKHTCFNNIKNCVFERCNFNKLDIYGLENIRIYQGSISYLNLRGEIDDVNFDFIEETIVSGLRINKSHMQLEKIPFAILGDSLKSLDLSFNNLRKVPLELVNIKSLREVNLRYNLLEELPDELSSIPLDSLKLFGNNITHEDVQNFQCHNIETCESINGLQLPPSCLRLAISGPQIFNDPASRLFISMSTSQLQSIILCSIHSVRLLRDYIDCFGLPDHYLDGIDPDMAIIIGEGYEFGDDTFIMLDYQYNRQKPRVIFNKYSPGSITWPQWAPNFSSFLRKLGVKGWWKSL
ncbi:hypothetical protein [Candidatus Uabimicrobium sp. HlEnr_7]|uniref:hypothetical protein n=1 Tax=Candidatus Uabimicrobium helgolandensis TaxID=3095367 RepID=UPI0035583923